MEIETYTLVKKEPLVLKFNSEQYGIFGSNIELSEKIVTTHGVCLEIKGSAKFKSIRSEFPFWYSFRANSIGHAANMAEIDQDIIAHWVDKNPDLVCRSLAEIESDHAHRLDFKRSKRPFVCIEGSDGPEWVVLWEFYPELARIGVYMGRDAKGLGGHVRFYDLPDFVIISNSSLSAS